MRPEGKGDGREGRQEGDLGTSWEGVSGSGEWELESGPAERVSGKRTEGSCCVRPLGGHRHL